MRNVLAGFAVMAVVAGQAWGGDVEIQADKMVLSPESTDIEYRSLDMGGWIHDVVHFGRKDLILKRQWFEEPSTLAVVTVDGRTELHITPPPGKAECCTCRPNMFEHEGECFFSQVSWCEECYQCAPPKSGFSYREHKDIDVPTSRKRVVRIKESGCDISQ
jgi:hypothetical protein